MEASRRGDGGAEADGTASADAGERAHFLEGSVGRRMRSTVAVFGPETTVAEAVERLRDVVRREFVTYGFVVEGEGRLVGVIAMRELLLAEPGQPLGSLMVRDPFCLRPEASLLDAIREALRWSLPVYPVCDRGGRLVGVIRGQDLFEAQAVEISAIPGRMVGIDREERLSTPLSRSFRLRHPWLQVNLLTAFAAAAVVGLFQSTIDRIVLLAAFLPVLAGQAGNTGAQALAVTLRGMTLGDLAAPDDRARRLLAKEALLGFLNGALVGLAAAAGMYFYASSQHFSAPLRIAGVVFLAMVGGCTAGGVSGALVPLLLKRLGTDPANASSIFLSTATDVASMGLFLALASWLLG